MFKNVILAWKCVNRARTSQFTSTDQWGWWNPHRDQWGCFLSPFYTPGRMFSFEAALRGVNSLSRFDPTRLSSYLFIWFSLSATGHVPNTGLNTGHNEIFKMKEKICPIKASPLWPQASWEIMLRTVNPLPEKRTPIDFYLMSHTEKRRVSAGRFHDVLNACSRSHYTLEFVCGCRSCFWHQKKKRLKKGSSGRWRVKSVLTQTYAGWWRQFLLEVYL